MNEPRPDDIACDLRRLIDGEVRFSQHDRLLYATDASIYQHEPIGVVVPRTIADVQRVVAYAAEHSLPTLPRGGGTSLAGQAVNRALVIDFSAYCRNILAIDPQTRTARVEPGVVLAQLNREVLPHGLMFGSDVATASHANIGGMIGNNSSGAHSVLYGRTVEHLLGLDVLLADGTRLRLDQAAAERDERVAHLTRHIDGIIAPIADQIDQRYPKIIRRVNGYNLDLILAQMRGSAPGTFDRVNLAHLFCGAEGTLGVTVEAHLQLVPAPPCRGLAIVAFENLDEALAAVSAALATGPAAVELVDEMLIGLAQGNADCRRLLDLLPRKADGGFGPVLYVEYFADSGEECKAHFDALAGGLEVRPPGVRMRRLTRAADMAGAWKLRAAGEPLLHGLPGARKPLAFVEDAAVDPKRLPEFVGRFRRIIAAHDTTAAYYAHASVGCLHVRPLIDLRDRRDRAAMQSMAAQLTDLVMEYGGALSGEHGDGRLRSHLLERFYGSDIVNAFRQIKALFDPQNRMNPGNIVAPLPMVQHLRVIPEDRAIEFPPAKTHYRYEREHGFGAALELCNGAGVCRKMTGGTMCPSYRATLDERHATRGRGNALRLAISGQFSPDGAAPAWNDPETLKTLDLCLSCKACKSECPSNVDIAKLKAEFLAQSYDHAGRVPLHTRLFGHVRRINRAGSALRWIANPLGRLGIARRVMQAMLGVDARRSLPRFERALRQTSKRPNVRTSRGGEKPGAAQRVLLFPDCFTMYNEPHIGRAAARCLSALGCEVILPRTGCCGRSMISIGMLAEARRTVNRTAEALLAEVKQHEPAAIVFCEPSCLSAVIDDWQELKVDVDREALALFKERAVAVEEFVARAAEARPAATARPPPSPEGGARPVLLHGHCHQKALWGTDATARLFTELLGDRFAVIDSGCCGMAGSFGLAADHYDLSMRIGELSLFPAVREQPDAIILAPGTSCRHQLRDGTGREAKHPIELLAEYRITGRTIAAAAAGTSAPAQTALRRCAPARDTGRQGG